jgi:hypothetical protein
MAMITEDKGIKLEAVQSLRHRHLTIQN